MLPSETEPAAVLAHEVTVSYQRDESSEPVVAVQGANLDVASGEFVSIVGPSGCGKTTFLKALHGLLPVAEGAVYFNGELVTGPSPERTMVFQQPSLLPWRTVLRNVMYGQELQPRFDRAAARARAHQLINLVDLVGFEHAYPRELSGGMQQRVNLARALATDPAMLLLDEPFAALDAQTREFMQQELLTIWSQTGKTAIFITHDIAEAIYLADRVAVFSARPGCVKRTVTIDLERPRPLSIKRSVEFLKYEQEIWADIENEVKTAKARSSGEEVRAEAVR